jgi:Thioredoxin
MQVAISPIVPAAARIRGQGVGPATLASIHLRMADTLMRTLDTRRRCNTIVMQPVPSQSIIVSTNIRAAAQVTFYKVNCNKSFKERGKELGIKVAPTFIVYKGGEQERMITGAKLDAIKDMLAELGG